MRKGGKKRGKKCRIAAQLSLETGLEVITWELIKNFPLWGNHHLNSMLRSATDAVSIWAGGLVSKNRRADQS